MSKGKKIIGPSKIGEYINSGMSGRFLKLDNNEDIKRNEREWKKAWKPLNFILSDQGIYFEERVYDKIEQDDSCIDSFEDWENFDNVGENYEIVEELVNKLKDDNFNEGDFYVLKQFKMSDYIGDFLVSGDSDLIIIRKGKNSIYFNVFDIKASWEKKTYHEIQTSCYINILENNINLEGVDINGGIVNYETDIEDISNVSFFDHEPHVKDIINLLEEGGRIYRLFEKDLDDIEYSLNGLDLNGQFSEVNAVESYESKNLRLLGLSKNEQKAFKRCGLKNLEDVANLIEVPENPKPYEYNQLKIKNENIVNDLIEKHGIDKDIEILGQKAQVLLNFVNPEHPSASDYSFKWISGSGPGNLPAETVPWENGRVIDLVNIYIDVQEDYINDSTCMLSYRLGGSFIDDINKEYSYSKVIEDIKRDNIDKVEEFEQELIKDFYNNLYSDLKDISERKDRESFSFHFVFYDSNSFDRLIDTVNNYYDNIFECRKLSNLLTEGGEVNQSMYSILENELDRIGFNHISKGLIPICYSLNGGFNKNPFTKSDWDYIDRDGDLSNLSEVFKSDLFDFGRKYDFCGDSVKINSDGSNYHTILPYNGSEIPLEYFWGCKEINLLKKIIEESDSQAKDMSKIFLWHDSKNRDKRISKHDLRKLGERMCYAIEYVENSIIYKNHNIDKPEVNVLDTMESNKKEKSISEYCLDFLDIENRKQKEEILDTYSSNIKERVNQGISIPVKVEKVEKDEESRKIKLHCKTAYSDLGFDNPYKVSRKSRLKDNSDGSSSWLVATKLKEENGEYVEDIKRPSDIFNSPTVTLDIFEPKEEKVKLSHLPFNLKGEYISWHKDLTDFVNINENSKTVYPDEYYILDKNVDDLSSSRERTFLENCDNSNLVNMIDNIRNKNFKNNTDIFNEKHVNDFLNWVDLNYKYSPNNKQKDFIKELGSKIVLLQGPPGTGKTSGALSLGLISRLYSRSKDGNDSNFLITGSSNKSVDELLEDVSNLFELVKSESKFDVLKDTNLVRLCSSLPDKELDNVNYITTKNKEDLTSFILEELGKNSTQKDLDSYDTKVSNNIVFATPSMVYNIADKMFEGSNAEEVYNFSGGATEIFDLLCVDEASMMKIPSFLLSGSLLREECQIMISGDHRQMSPVKKNDWSNNSNVEFKREGIKLSVLNYLRFVRGEEVEGVDNCYSPKVNIPIIRLNRTYRCHTKVSNFLRDWIYDKDNIDYKSNVSYTIGEDIKDVNTFRESILSKENTILLVTHDDYTNQQSSYTEALITQKICNILNSKGEIGVVTPHNAQKGLIKSELNKNIQVDTVERYQGGERDIMLMSTTVSDPDYIEKESDFIMDPNRLNVGLSRMKNKLVVLAPKSIFNMIPNDKELYDKSIIWKALNSRVAKDENKVWSGTLNNINSDGSKSVNVDIFGF